MPAAIELWPLVAVTLAVALIFVSCRSKTHYPSGPKPRFLVGNFFDIPKSEAWKVYRDLGRLYGDYIHLELLGLHTVVINSWKIVDELFEKHSRIYSDRPSIPMLDMCIVRQ
ncbi:hypothetical protein L218DRAFT_926047 [Marasmius fiardii PR-910]|nr:hypothetical protein L218DRAFT_926047 [Marasmius fiardii PR-910]